MHAHSIVVLTPLVSKPSWCLSANQSKGGPAVGTASLFARSVAAVCLYRQDMVLGRFDVSDGCGGGGGAGATVTSLDMIPRVFSSVLSRLSFTGGYVDLVTCIVAFGIWLSMYRSPGVSQSSVR